MQIQAIISLAERYNLANKIEVCSDYEGMCSKIKNYSNQIKKREQFSNPTLILWLSMIDFYDELSAYGEYVEKDNEQGEAFEVSDEKALKALEDEKLNEMAAQLGMSVAEVMKMISKDTEEGAVKQELKPEEGFIYNAIADINTLLSSGSRYSLYSIVALENASDIKRLKDFKLSDFIHKIGYKMSGDDSFEFGFGRYASSLPKDDLVFYTNGPRRETFRPFLLK